MPKTRDAFAFRILDYGEELQNRAQEDLRQGNRELAYQLQLQVEDLVFMPFERHALKEPHIPDRVKSIEQSIRSCERRLVRANFLLQRVKEHDRRLGKILSACDPESAFGKRAIRLVGKYHRVKDSILGYIELINSLRDFNEETIRRAFNEEFGTRIRLARRRKGYTQEAVARELRITKAAYSNYELGRREVPPFFIYRLATLLDVSTEYLMGTTA